MIRIPLLLTSVFVYTLAFAQTVHQGQWKATIYPNRIIKLSWTHAGMQRQESIGDAVVAKALQAPFVLKQEPQGNAVPPSPAKPYMPAEDIGPGPVISYTQRSLKVIYREAVVEIPQVFDSGHVRGLQFNLRASEHWFGGGERSLPMQRNGQRIPLYNAPHYGYELNADELNYSVPFILNTEGYGLLFDNPSKGYLDFGKTTSGRLEAAFESGALNVYIIPGETPEQIIENYTALTGRQPLPPRWALGNFVSRFGYRSQQQVEEVVGRMKKDGFPVDALVIDIFWFGDSIKGTLGNLDWVNRSKWPQPQQMIANLRKQNINTILVTEPFFLKGTRQFKASLPHLATDSAGKPFMLTDFYFGYGGLLDLFKPEARQWFWQFYKKQTDLGVAGWWGDLGEPEKHPDGIHHNLQSFGVKRRMAANEVHNMYGHMWSRMLFDNWRKTYPNRRLFYLNRAGYAGSQRYSVFPWTGDVSRTWNGLRAQLPNLQSMSLSGLPYIHSDAGGFSNVPENDQELYVRWLQMAGFTPVFRPHGTAFGDLEPGVNDLPSEPVFKDEPYRSMAREVIRLRYSLLPYLYTMAWEQTTQGKPLIRPMMYQGAADSTLLKATDQYMFGSAFLVAPVLEKGATQRRVYLPRGDWYYWQDAAHQPGGRWMDQNVVLDHMPLYVKAGSLIPRWVTSQYQSTADYTSQTPLNLQYFPGSTNTSGYLYDDDGNTPQALQQPDAHQLIQWHSRWDGQQLVLTLEASRWPKGLTRSFLLQVPPGNTVPFTISQASVSLNGKPVVMVSNRMVNAWPQLPLSFSGQKLEIVFRPR